MQFYDPIRDAVFTPPADLADSGKYPPLDWAELKTNGQGIPVTAARATIIWQWDIMPAAHWDWWKVTFMPSELAFVRCTSPGSPKETWIWGNRVGVLVKLTSCIVHKPVAAYFGNGDYMNATVKISNIFI